MWEDKSINPAIAMEGSFQVVEEWKKARGKEILTTGCDTNVQEKVKAKWIKPEEGTLKLNVDASFRSDVETCTIGMLIRDHAGSFMEGRSISMVSPGNVLEAEAMGIREALSWVKDRQDEKLIIESDSLLAVQAIVGDNVNLLEFGHIAEHCKIMLRNMPGVSIHHVRKQANGMAHGLAKIPSLINCFSVFTSPPTHLLETYFCDISNE